MTWTTEVAASAASFGSRREANTDRANVLSPRSSVSGDSVRDRRIVATPFAATSGGRWGVSLGISVHKLDELTPGKKRRLKCACLRSSAAKCRLVGVFGQAMA